MKQLLCQISAHWDREWYRQFQGFRYYLVEMTDDLLYALENGDIPEFVFDGQTIVLEDYLEIRAENRPRLEKLITEGKIKIGPWYVMPDEIIVSGEGLVENLLVGHNIAHEFGVRPWKFGYVCDMFGHIAQLPQIFNGFGIDGVYLGRGITRLPNGTKFLWRSPDGSECVVCKDNYANFKRSFDRAEDKENFLAERLKGDLAVINYSDDHATISKDTFEFARLVKKCGYEIGGFEKLSELVNKDELEVVCGELIETAHKPDFRVVTGSISSYYPLKQLNDRTENMLWLETGAVIMMGELCGVMNGKRKFFDIARRYLLKNHPHDSICGCSIDAVHEDMPYRFNQAMAIGGVINEEFKSKAAAKLGSKLERGLAFSIVNTDIHNRDGVAVFDIDFPIPWASVYGDNVGYQSYNLFTLRDSSGNEIPYQILKIKRGVEAYIRQDAVKVDRYTIAADIKLIPFGFTTFTAEPCNERKAVPPKHPERRMIENEFLRVEVNHDGTLNITEKASGRCFERLNDFIDDADSGNGWFHEGAAFDEARVISTKDVRIEAIHFGELANTLRITRTMEIPTKIDKYKKDRSNVYEEMDIVSEVTLRKGQRFVEFHTTVDNKVGEHRLRVIFPTDIVGDRQYASQAFCFVERERGSSAEGYAGREVEFCEKNTTGIVGTEDVAFVGAEGFHEGGVYPDGTISMTMFRSVGKMFHQPEAEYAKLIGKMSFSYAFAIGCEKAELISIQKNFAKLNVIFSNIPERSFMSLNDKRILVSVIKPEENGSGMIVRLYNPTNEKISTVFKSDLPSFESSLDETELKHTESLNFEPYEIKTLIVGRN